MSKTPETPKTPKVHRSLAVLVGDPQGVVLGLELPAGGVLSVRGEPLLWVSDGPVGVGALAAHRSPALAAAGLQAVLLQGRRGLEEWWRDRELRPQRMSDPDDHHVEPVLRDFWHGVVPDPEEGEEGDEIIAPFGRDWPGLAEAGPVGGADPEVAACELADELIGSGSLPSPRLALVPAARGADVPTAMGWCGPTNHENDTARISAVLRSWEDRFGARVVALGFDELYVSVAAPPPTVARALPVAAEHFAFAPDNIWQGCGTIRAYAGEAVTGSNLWGFWWD
ncbi:DUF4253 domain-containing protein [Streptomyces sp. NRRL F-2580]|uniref:DUF4253 domain-containing protein n=1 Tax=Streptomyces sp. NRRL F-2580 TaxID=1463841 RepID=UPI00099C4BC2|nr:DUF4253 domain-containing protein [Streptomyces sp. NRRL F-2580]